MPVSPVERTVWAGAGICRPPAHKADDGPGRWRISNGLHAIWHERLLAETGIDNGYRRSGGIYLARDRKPRLPGRLRIAAVNGGNGDRGVPLVADSRGAGQVEPGLLAAGRLQAAFFLVGRVADSQSAASEGAGGRVSSAGRRNLGRTPAEDFAGRGERRRSRGDRGRADGRRHNSALPGEPGAAAIVGGLAIRPPIRPVRGQIALVALAAPPLIRVVNEAAVPRSPRRRPRAHRLDRRGCRLRSQHHAGAIAGLHQFGLRVFARRWRRTFGANLGRTAAAHSPDGLPYLGRVGQLANAFVAAGHSRSRAAAFDRYGRRDGQSAGR